MLDNIPGEVLNFLTGPNTSLEECVSEGYRFESPMDLERLREIGKGLFFGRVRQHYDDKGIRANMEVCKFLLEPLKNANFHGGSDKERRILIRLLLSPVAFVAGFNDGGAYFKKDGVKEYWEMRKPFPEIHQAEGGQIGFGVGTPLIYGMADLIYVEKTSGTLYLGLSTNGKYFGFKKTLR